MRFPILLSAALLVPACAGSEPTGPLTLPVFSHANQRSPTAPNGSFGTAMSGAEEVMPAGVVNTSDAVGSALFQLSGDGASLSYRLIVANIDNVFQAHIHAAAAGSNGGIVVWLFPSTAPTPGPLGGGPFDGVIAEGTITSADLVGALQGEPLSALISLLSTGGAYVNAHTNDGVAPTNTGPGDYPGGEIRGQIEHRGH
jgi:hypothetical protein